MLQIILCIFELYGESKTCIDFFVIDVLQVDLNLSLSTVIWKREMRTGMNLMTSINSL